MKSVVDYPDSGTAQSQSDQQDQNLLADMFPMFKHLLKKGALPGAVAAGSTQAFGQQLVAVNPVTTVDAAIVCPALAVSPSAEQKLAMKATFGYTNVLEQDIITQGYNNWLKAQINYAVSPAWIAFEQAIEATYPSINDLDNPSSPEYAAFCSANAMTRNANRRELVKARVHRASESPCQLYERMVEFWTDHLNTFHLTPGIDRMKHWEDRFVIRPNALGKIKDILKGSALSPAMLLYLDGNNSKAVNPNENYARELLELHALGVDVCYDEQTIRDLAKALTGWRVNTCVSNCGTPPNVCATVTFNNNDHDNSAKTLIFPNCNYQYMIPANSGINEIDLVIDMLTKPTELGTRMATFIAAKMARYFFRCKPPTLLVREMVSAYVRAYNAGVNDIAAMVQVMLSKRWIHCAGPILKRPLHLVSSALRVTATWYHPGPNSTLTGTGVGPGDETLANTVVGGFLNATGHRPYMWPAPDGYPEACEQDYWGVNQLGRWNMGAAVYSGQVIGLDLTVIAQGLGVVNNQQLMDALDTIAFGGFMPAFDKNRILTYMNNNPQVNGLEKAEGVQLTVASPGFQWY